MAPSALEREDKARDASFNKALHGNICIYWVFLLLTSFSQVTWLLCIRDITSLSEQLPNYADHPQ